MAKKERKKLLGPNNFGSENLISQANVGPKIMIFLLDLDK